MSPNTIPTAAPSRYLDHERRAAIVAHILATGMPALPIVELQHLPNPEALVNAAIDRMSVAQLTVVETEMRLRARAAPRHSFDYDPYENTR